MTIAEFQPHVEAAVVALEWQIARVRWRHGLIDEQIAIEKAIPLAGQFGVEEAPLRDRLDQILAELHSDVTADRVPLHPIRSVPMDLITIAVVRRILGLPEEFPVLSLKALPSEALIAETVAAIAARWQQPFKQVSDAPEPQIVVQPEHYAPIVIE